MQRVLSIGDLLVIAAASIGPAFVLATVMGPMVVSGGSASPFAILVVALVMACIALGYRRLGQHYPTAGSAYSWVHEAFGSGAGAYAAWVLVIANMFATVATAVPAGAYTLALFAPERAPSPRADALVAAGWVLASGLLLARGLRPTARVTNTLLLAELVMLVAGAAIALTHAPVAHAAAAAPFPGTAAFIAAMVIGIWMLDGWEVSASTAEEAQSARRAPGVGALGGLALSAGVLWLCTTAFLRVVTIDGFAAHEGDAMAYVGATLGGGGWRIAVAALVLVSLAASLQTTMVYLTRSFYAMGRDGVLPPALGVLNARRQPGRAIAFMTVTGVCFTLASGLSSTIRDAFDFVLAGTSMFLGLLFAMSAFASAWLFGRKRMYLVDGVVLPSLGALAITALLVASFAHDDSATRTFVVVAAIVGVPIAWWRSAIARRVAPSVLATFVPATPAFEAADPAES